MKKNLAAIVIGCIATGIIITSCKKKETEEPFIPPVVNPAPVYSTSLSGLGAHGGLPSGTPYALPSNIKLVGSMYGGYYGGKSNQKTDKSLVNLNYWLSHKPKTDFTEYGYGTFVDVFMKLHNTSSSTYQLIIPAGVIMRPGDSIPDTTQSGLIIAPDTINIAGGDTIGVCLKSFCLNTNFQAPDCHKYQFAVVTNNDLLCKVILILKNKKTLAAHIYEIQEILWKITNDEGLSQADIDLMNSWL